MAHSRQMPQMAFNHDPSAKARFECFRLFNEYTTTTSEAPVHNPFAVRGLKDGLSRWPTSEPDTCDEAADETCADTSSGGEDCDEQLPASLVNGWRPGSAGASTQTPRSSLPPTPPPPEAPAQREAERVQLPEHGLVDLEESEGRKRGSELLMMLGAAAPAKAPPPPAAVGARPARGPLLATAAPFEPRTASENRGAQQSPTRGAADRARQSTQQATAKVLESSSRMYLDIVREAAFKAFGDDMAHVEGDLSSGFNVQLSDRSRHCSAMERLEDLGRELWPRLPCDSVAALEPGSIGKRAWLTMHYVLAAPPDNCWDYASTGCCPRGQLCRWPHALPQNLTVDIEVAR